MTRALVLALLVAVASSAGAQTDPTWRQPFDAMRIVGNVYYVGTRGLSSFLIVTPAGGIIIDSGEAESVPFIRASVEKLGFKFADIKILLISHAHSDHCAGSAEILRLTKARHLVMEGDADAVENGGAKKLPSGASDYTQFPPAHVDQKLKDGDIQAAKVGTFKSDAGPANPKSISLRGSSLSSPYDDSYAASLAEAHSARTRLVFDEFLRIQVRLVVHRRAIERERTGIEHQVDGLLVQTFLDTLPFTLTGAQQHATDEYLRVRPQQLW